MSLAAPDLPSASPLRMLLFLVLLCPAFMCLNTRGSSDMLYWNTWADKVVKLGPVKGYEDIRRDYPPLASMTVGAAYWLGSKYGLDVTTSIKCVLLVIYGVSLLVFWKLTRHYWATVLAAAGLLVHAVALGYLDIVYMSFLVGALTAFVAERWLLFAVFYALTCLVKWQPLILAPFFALHLWRQFLLTPQWRSGAVLIAKQVLLPVAIILGITLFIFGIKPVGAAFHMAFRGEDHRALSLQALNLPWVATHVIEWLMPDKFPEAGRNMGMASLDQGEAQPLLLPSEGVHILTRLPFMLMYLFLLFRVWRSGLSPWKTLLGAMLGYFSYFMLATGVHENHLFTAVVLAIFLFAHGQLRLEYPVLLALIINANLLMFYRLDGAKLHEGDRAFMRTLDPALLTAVANVITYFCIVWSLVKLLPAREKSPQRSPLPSSEGASEAALAQ
jgi:hypothetical protein